MAKAQVRVESLAPGCEIDPPGVGEGRLVARSARSEHMTHRVSVEARSSPTGGGPDIVNFDCQAAPIGIKAVQQVFGSCRPLYIYMMSSHTAAATIEAL